MCGRYVVKKPVTKVNILVKSAIQIEDTNNYNAHPYQRLPVIKKYKNGNTLEKLHWGLVPKWAKDKNFKALINARLETIDEKISFKKLINNNRCVAVADGFYEWKRDEKEKTPHYFERLDHKTIFFAAIFDGDQFCLITEEAKNKIKEIHHRQPVILNQNDVSGYLNKENQGSAFLNKRKVPDLIFHEVSKDVNKPTNNNASLLQPVQRWRQFSS